MDNRLVVRTVEKSTPPQHDVTGRRAWGRGKGSQPAHGYPARSHRAEPASAQAALPDDVDGLLDEEAAEPEPDDDPAPDFTGPAVEEPFEDPEPVELLPASDAAAGLAVSDPFVEAPADSVALPLPRESFR